MLEAILGGLKLFGGSGGWRGFVGDRIAFPEPFEGLGEGLLFDGAVAMAGVAGEGELVVIAFVGQGFGGVFVGDDPIVHVVAHDVWVEEVAVADFHPDADRLCGAIGNEVFVKFPGAVRGFGARRPLLIYEGA